MFRKMDETEVAIKKIEKIRMLHIYELTGGNLQTDGRGLTALAVYYGENQQINMNETQPHFALLVNRVYEIYMETEAGGTIVMDDATKAFMESGAKIGHEIGLAPFYDMEEVGPVMACDSMLSRCFMPLVEYWVTGFYKVLGAKFEVRIREAGWRGAGLLSGMLDGEEKSLYYRIMRLDEDRYSVQIPGFDEENQGLLMNFRLGQDFLEYSFRAEVLQFYGDGRVDFSQKECTEKCSIFHEGKQVFYDTQKHANIADQVKTTDGMQGLFPDNREGKISAVYMLPWKMSYVLHEKQSDEKGMQAQLKIGTYLMADGDYAETRGAVLLHSPDKGMNLHTDCLFLRTLRLSEGRKQTYFVPITGMVTGSYKKHLADKFFIYSAQKDKVQEG